MKTHETFIRRCILLAQNGHGRTYPNPKVGSVVVYKDRIIGEGWHHKAGEPHAEVNAINAVKNKDLLSASTIFVSLEPCSHFGKTPPCSDLIIASGIRKVVIGTVDPFAKVAGRGIKKLRDAGCKVSVGILEKECQLLNSRFFTYHQKKRPYVILKWAESFDGFLSPPPSRNPERKPVWITSKYSRQLVHKWRTEEQAILVGTNTAVADNPSLTSRAWHGPDPIRIVLDQHRRIPTDSALFDKTTKTIVITADPDKSQPKDNLIFETADFNHDLPLHICNILYRHEVQSVIIEGGAYTLQSFIDADLWDEARIFKGAPMFGEGTHAPILTGTLISEKQLLGDILKIYRND